MPLKYHEQVVGVGLRGKSTAEANATTEAATE